MLYISKQKHWTQQRSDKIYANVDYETLVESNDIAILAVCLRISTPSKFVHFTEY